MMWLTDWMIDHFPMYNKFRTVASILVVAEVAMPILAVLGLRELFKDPDGWRKHKVALVASFGLCALICLLSAIFPGIFGHFSAEEHEQLVASGQIQQYPSVDAAIAAVRGALVSGDAWRSLIVILLGFGIIFAYLKGKVNEMVATLVVAAIVLVDMYDVNKRYINADTFVKN